MSEADPVSRRGFLSRTGMAALASASPAVGRGSNPRKS
jgi:hypothetical protein